MAVKLCKWVKMGGDDPFGVGGWTDRHSHELIRFPGGEWHVKGPSFSGGSYTAIVQGASADDLFALAVLADAVQRDGGKLVVAIPYFPGARQDRRQTGEALSAKVYADFVNRLPLEQVMIVDPHSPVITALLDRCTVVDWEIERLVTLRLSELEVDYIIAPDLGAVKRAEKIASLMGVQVIQATKKRDMATGKLSGFDITIPDHSKRYAIVDDICDGGGTFVGLAKAADLLPRNLLLWVTHGIFSGKAKEVLPQWFDRIITTNSIQDPWESEQWTRRAQFEIINIDHLFL